VHLLHIRMREVLGPFARLQKNWTLSFVQLSPLGRAHCSPPCVRPARRRRSLRIRFSRSPAQHLIFGSVDVYQDCVQRVVLGVSVAIADCHVFQSCALDVFHAEDGRAVAWALGGFHEGELFGRLLAMLEVTDKTGGRVRWADGHCYLPELAARSRRSAHSPGLTSLFVHSSDASRNCAIELGTEWHFRPTGTPMAPVCRPCLECICRSAIWLR
jgi:hypothetical protein